MKKIILTIIVLAIIIVLVVVALIIWQGSQGVKDDSTSAIDKDLESIDMVDLDKEFEVIDNDLKSL